MNLTSTCLRGPLIFLFCFGFVNNAIAANPAARTAYFRNAPRSCVEKLTNGSRLFAPTLGNIFLLESGILNTAQLPMGRLAQSVLEGNDDNIASIYANYIITISRGDKNDALTLLKKLNRLQARCEMDRFLSFKEDLEVLRKMPRGSTYQTAIGRYSRDKAIKERLRLMQNQASATAIRAEIYRDTEKVITTYQPFKELGGKSKGIRASDIPISNASPTLKQTQDNMMLDLRSYRKLCQFHPLEYCSL